MARKKGEARGEIDALVESTAKLQVNKTSDDAAASPGAAVTDDKILINHAAYKNHYVTRVIMVESLLKEENIVLVGEGNFTFTVALAAIRGSWDGVVSTRYERVKLLLRPQFDEVKKECIEFCHNNGKKLESNEDTIKDYVEAVDKVNPPPEKAWQFEIDATATPDSLVLQGKVVMFQCPWKARRDPETPATLIEAFLSHMSTKQDEGDYVLIGICTLFPYVIDYNLEDLLGKKLSRKTDKSGRYDFLGADDTFIRKILLHGYHHTTCHGSTDIHNDIIHNHLTLIFQRNGVSTRRLGKGHK